MLSHAAAPPLSFATILSLINCCDNNRSGIYYKRDLYCKRRRLGIAVHRPAAPIGILLERAGPSDRVHASLILLPPYCHENGQQPRRGSES
jgi:hypothetical protein